MRYFLFCIILFFYSSLAGCFQPLAGVRDKIGIQYPAPVVTPEYFASPSLDPNVYINPTSTTVFSGPQNECYIDPSNRFSIILPPGWYAYPPYGGIGSTEVTNYDVDKVTGDDDILHNGGLKVSIGSYPLTPDQSFEEWVQEWLATLPQDQDPQPDFEDPAPYQVGEYSGVSFQVTALGNTGEEIVLDLGNRVIVIGVLPKNSLSMKYALEMLRTLHIDSDKCRE